MFLWNHLLEDPFNIIVCFACVDCERLLERNGLEELALQYGLLDFARGKVVVVICQFESGVIRVTEGWLWALLT